MDEVPSVTTMPFPSPLFSRDGTTTTTVDSIEAGGAGVGDDDGDVDEIDDANTSWSGVVVGSVFPSFCLGVDEDCCDISFLVVSFEDSSVTLSVVSSFLVDVVEKNDFVVDVNAMDDAADIIGNDEADRDGENLLLVLVNNENLTFPPPPPPLSPPKPAWFL